MLKQTTAKKAGASIDELAYEYGLSRGTLYTLANERKLPGARRLGRRIIVHRETFEAWVAAGNGGADESDAQD